MKIMVTLTAINCGLILESFINYIDILVRW
jgi:hypothetical protein